MVYDIKRYISPDDFTNVGALVNQTGEIFVATGTTPANWLQKSELMQLAPIVIDRNVVLTTIDFQISRVHATISAAEEFIFDHDANIPSFGDVQFTASDGDFRFLIHARLITHQLIRYIGKTTTHAYHIEGGQLSTHPAYYILTESSDYILTEDGYKIETEH